MVLWYHVSKNKKNPNTVLHRPKPLQGGPRCIAWPILPFPNFCELKYVWQSPLPQPLFHFYTTSMWLMVFETGIPCNGVFDILHATKPWQMSQSIYCRVLKILKNWELRLTVAPVLASITTSLFLLPYAILSPSGLYARHSTLHL